MGQSLKTWKIGITLAKELVSSVVQKNKKDIKYQLTIKWRLEIHYPWQNTMKGTNLVLQ